VRVQAGGAPAAEAADGRRHPVLTLPNASTPTTRSKKMMTVAVIVFAVVACIVVMAAAFIYANG
jgi:hypothetical protein